MSKAEGLMPPVHPGEVLREDFMKPLGLTVNRLALELHVPATRIGEIVHERRRISAETALRLARYFMEIKKGGSVLGELTTARIMIEDGAYFKAAVEIERGNTRVRTAPDALLTLAEKHFKLKSIRAAGSSQ
jgi:addiction module HigA family antidote